jgi:hypothetical protein
LAAEVFEEAFAEDFDAADGFVAHDDGQGDGELAEPEVDVGAGQMPAISIRTTHSPGQRGGEGRVLADFEGLFVGREDGGGDGFHGGREFTRGG